MTDTFTFSTVDAIVPPDPWSAQAFQVRRYGTRYYGDQLPACPIAEPTGDTWPGFSSIKPHRPFKKSVIVNDVKKVVPLDLFTAHQWLEQHPTYTETEFYDCVRLAQDRAFARGHAIHAVAEAELTSRPIPQWALDNVDAAPYLPHVRDWIQTNVEHVLCIEAVVINRTLGYGGTGDAWLHLRNGLDVYCDWKSRGEDSAHGIYDEEIGQGGAYTGAEYMIGPTEDRTAAQRVCIPQTTHGVVVSIRPDSAEAFYYDLDVASDVFAHMYNAYQSTKLVGRTATKAKKVAVPTVPTVVEQRVTGTEGAASDFGPVTNLDRLKARARKVAELDPEAAAVMAATWPDADDELAIEVHIAKFETSVSAPFTPPPKQPATEVTAEPEPEPVTTIDRTPDEGPVVADNDPAFLLLQKKYSSLGKVPGGSAWMAQTIGESITAHRSLHMASLKSLRRVRIVDGLLTLYLADAAEAVRDLTYIACDIDDVLTDTVPLGAAVSAMSAVQAATFSELAAAFVADCTRFTVIDGHISLTSSANTTSTSQQKAEAS